MILTALTQRRRPRNSTTTPMSTASKPFEIGILISTLLGTGHSVTAEIAIDSPTPTFAKEAGGGSALSSGAGACTTSVDVQWVASYEMRLLQ